MPQKQEPASTFLLRRNLILREALIAAPVAVCADSLRNALLLCFVFCIVTAFTVLLSAFIPQRIPFSLRILCYSLIAALVYVPAALAGDYLFPEAGTGAYLPVLSVGLLLTAEHDRLFQAENLKRLCGHLICALLGVCGVILPFGCIRELLGSGTLSGRVFFLEPPLPILNTPAAGMILLACCCILAEAVCALGEES